ncbi:MAG TPA: nucleotidyltransferase family protein [Candidatus Nanoarchaeia archaeon]|nr:nucleotidyltransferase family protein [Candidatus Nanoarchaeia archaeon]
MRKDVLKIKQKITPILKRYKVKRAGIFGSYVRGEHKQRSDVDVLIQPPRSMSLLKFVHIKHELEEKLNKKVDLVSYKGIHPLLKDQILKEEVKII